MAHAVHQLCVHGRGDFECVIQRVHEHSELPKVRNYRPDGIMLGVGSSNTSFVLEADHITRFRDAQDP
jgi:hypothetical protein